MCGTKLLRQGEDRLDVHGDEDERKAWQAEAKLKTDMALGN